MTGMSLAMDAGAAPVAQAVDTRTAPTAPPPTTEERFDPVADPAAVVISGEARFTLLTPQLIRLEYAPGGKFEDRASLGFVNRKLPVPKFVQASADGTLTIKTDALTLRYKVGSGPFTAANLQIDLSAGDKTITWNPETPDKGNLLGTTRTLDGVSGSCPLEPGILSRSGWAVVDESKRPLFGAGGTFAARTEGVLDWYFFGYGPNYKQALADFTKVAGRIPLPPRYVFGAWWSRYWAYSADELKELVAEFEKNDVPLDVLVIDMDWHLDGWTGYTWNPKYFPDPAGFLKWTHERGLKTTLNLHPAEGVGKQESPFADFCKALGLDPEKTERVPFDCTDPKYMDAYFKLLHHPLEKQGIDFWWMDWQQGRETKVSGLDPLFALNHLHWRDQALRERETNLRPLVFSRWGGIGNHRYQIGFSGDTFCNWPSLAFQPYFTATAGNVGYAYWSHDIGGHQPGQVEPELYTRWVQWGAFSPILRTHTTKNPLAERRIWKFELPYFEAMRAAFHLRYLLIPYIYTQARISHESGLPLCRPMYLDWPQAAESYVFTNQYMFGEDLLVAPVTTPLDPTSERALVRVWLPPGSTWTNWFTGRTYEGGEIATLLVPLDEIPLFVRGGAIIPMQPKGLRSDPPADAPLVFATFPGEHGAGRRYDDSRVGPGHVRGEYEWTNVSQEHSPGQRLITIAPRQGRVPGSPESRSVEIRVCYTRPPEEVLLNGEPLKQGEPGTPDTWSYDLDHFAAVIRTRPLPADKPATILVQEQPEDLDDITLRKGLREQVKLLQSVSGLLGRSTPQTIREATEFMRTPPHNGRFWTHNIVVRWPHLLLDTSKLVLDEPRRSTAIIRLCGLAVEIDAGIPEDEPKQLAAFLRITPTLDVPAVKELSGALLLSNDAGWEPASEVSTQFYDVPQGTIAGLDARFKTDGTVQTATLTGAVRVQFAELIAEVKVSRTIFPSINNWWVTGPFDLSKLGLLRPGQPESGFDPAAEFDGKYDVKVTWKECQRPFKPGARVTDEHFVHLHEFFGRRYENAVAYAQTFLHSPKEQDAILAFGTDDGAVVWVNGGEVYRKDIGRAYSAKEERVKIRLRQGANPLLLKISQQGGDWGFGAHVESLDGQPLSEVKAYLAP